MRAHEIRSKITSVLDTLAIPWRAEHAIDGSILDLLVLDGTMHGIEIKSEHDSLSRLGSYSGVMPGTGTQVQSMQRWCERCSIVVPYRLLPGALERVPPWWGILLLDGESLHGLRAPRYNPELLANPLRYVDRWIWKMEWIAIARKHGLRGYTREPCLTVLQGLPTWRDEVMQTLMRRVDPRGPHKSPISEQTTVPSQVLAADDLAQVRKMMVRLQFECLAQTKSREARPAQSLKESPGSDDKPRYDTVFLDAVAQINKR